jgi:hypothetical protein
VFYFLKGGFGPLFFICHFLLTWPAGGIDEATPLRSGPESPVAAPKKMEELTIACLQVLFKSPI